MNTEIPDSIVEYVKTKENAYIHDVYESLSANGGYAHIFHRRVFITMATRPCVKCGYDEIKHPELWDKCQRHTYGSPVFIPTFYWCETDQKSLEQSFNDWREVADD